MKRYRVNISGENFLLDLDGHHEKFCFSATRLIEANSPEDAERIALIRIHHELNQTNHIVKNTLDAPRVSIDSIEELKFFQFLSKKSRSKLEFKLEDPQTEAN